MQVGSAVAWTMFGSTGTSSKTTSAKSSVQLTILQNQTKALDTLRETMRSSADIEKERAARKLEEAKQELEMLKSGGMPPEVVVRLAAELAHKVSAAATQFAAAVAASAGSASAATAVDAAAGTATAGAEAGNTSAADTGATDAASVISADDTDNDGDTGQADELDDATPARNAYKSVAEDGESASSGISAEDRKTMEEFKSLLRDIKQVMDKAMRDLREKNTGNGNEPTGAASFGGGQAAASTPSSIIV